MKQFNEPIYVTRPYKPQKEKLFKYLEQVLDSRYYTNFGPLHNLLEERLRQYLGVKHVILTANGTLALQIAYKALNVKKKAISTPFTFIATVSSLIWEGIEPVLADIDPHTFTLDPDKIEKNIDSDVTAIVPVHVFGNPAPVEEIEYLGKEYSIPIIYDAAHTFGVNYRGKSLSSYGNISILSFHATKLFNTLEGGAIVTNNDSIVDTVKAMRNFGITDSQTGEIKTIGINAKMNEFEAAMGLAVLDDMEYIISTLRKNYNIYKELLSDYLEFQVIRDHTDYNYMYVPVLFPDEESVMRVKNELNKHDIYPRRYFYPSLDTISFIKSLCKCEISRRIASTILCLPNYVGLEEDTIVYISDIIKNTLKDIKK
ncbi:DegT/DnrJ/EryC1/StrS family aminotransferase [Acidianus sp. HS-5]|uniref:DegT/DnrJ/EryC1/StrS family aminotransferase n=1 Tax=Acidianus sp. HS-5 TaxID=2886040 RepID=UPI001F204EDD|nr:DegT/DnrJ/EryC1/StrS family aminotransferase [Acidianus sp. HS-5]BDC17405.1 aminotransferase DegT [Acidianus sp. HS-5]